MTSATLNRKLRHYSVKISKNFSRHNRLPATIIGAEYKDIQRLDYAGKVPDPIDLKLKNELEKIAPLGTKGIDNFVGCCCEVRAANKILLQSKAATIEYIDFTVAIRPRTGQTIKRCKNCKKVFG